MNDLTKILLFGVLLISLTSFGGTFSYIGDSACSVGNSISVAEWDEIQADFLGVDVSQGQLVDDQKQLRRIILEDARCDDEDSDDQGEDSDDQGEDFSESNEYEGIVIDRIQIYWDITKSDSANVVGITLNDDLFFSGSAHYGEIIEGTDVVLCPENSPCEVTFLFDVPVSGPFDIWFIMTDGSRKNVFFDVSP